MSDSQTSELARAIQDVTERTQVLIREEIELAKVEVTTKAKKLARGAAIGAAAGIFIITGLLYFLHALSWLLFVIVKDDGRSVWMGYGIVAIALFILGGLAGFMAARLFKAGAPPTPDMAIQEGKLIKETITGEHPELGRGA